jgi:hypothetical protein
MTSGRSFSDGLPLRERMPLQMGKSHRPSFSTSVALKRAALVSRRNRKRQVLRKTSQQISWPAVTFEAVCGALTTIGTRRRRRPLDEAQVRLDAAGPFCTEAQKKALDGIKDENFGNMRRQG